MSKVGIGATASVKVSAGFSAFGSAKIALRGLAQSLARELGPQGVHFANPIIDGIMREESADERLQMRHEQCLDPEAVAFTCLQLLDQERSAKIHELDIRLDVDTF